MNRHPAARRTFPGFTLVETMVALVIGLLATLIVMEVYATSEGSKRTITGGADAQSDAAVALYLIERDLRQAGYGLAPNPEDFLPSYTAPKDGGVLTDGILAQCTTVDAYNTTRGAFTYANSTFAPVVINPTGYPPGDDDTDVVLVNYGTSGGMIGRGVLLQTNSNPGVTTQTGGDTLDYRVDTNKGNRAGFAQGDLILAVPPHLATGCTIAEVTGLPNAPSGCTVAGNDPNIEYINHNAVAYPNAYSGCNPTDATWNAPGVGTPYSAGSRVYNLGPVGSFVSRVYAVRKGNLTVCDVTVNDCTAAVADPPDPAVWTPVATGVVGFKAQYGKDPDYNGIINAWNNDNAGLTGAAGAQVAAVRVAVVVRSAQFEKEVVTTADPVWHQDATGTANVNLDVSGSISNWDHYRYKTAQSIVPVRNMIWGEQN